MRAHHGRVEARSMPSSAPSNARITPASEQQSCQVGDPTRVWRTRKACVLHPDEVIEVMANNACASDAGVELGEQRCSNGANPARVWTLTCVWRRRWI